MSAQDGHSGHQGPAVEAPDAATEIRWVARTVRPATPLQIMLVFMAAAHFIFDSTEAVRALALAALAAAAALLPAVLARVEYRADGTGVAKRFAGKGDAAPFGALFRWDDLDHAELTQGGFRYRLQLDE